MTTTEQSTTAQEQPASSAPPAAAGDDPATAVWLPVQRAVVATVLLTFLVYQLVIARTLIPVIVVMMIPFAAIGALTVRRPRGTSIGIGVLSLLSLLAFVPDIVRDLGDPESTAHFTTTGLLTVALGVGVVAGALTLRRRAPARGRSAMAVAAGLAVVPLLLIATVARVTLASDPAEPGDVQVTARDTRFVPDAVAVTAGAVGFHVDNRDLIPHDLTIDEIGMKLHVPERAARRVEADLPAGTYVAYCSIPGHERMELTITAS